MQKSLSLPPSISILIASRDRTEPLRTTVRSLFRLRRPAGSSLEVVLVASGSTSTEEAARALAAEAPRDLPVIVAAVARPGKSLAVNHGLTLCGGDVVAFTDDDVEFDEGWLEGALEAFSDAAVDGVQGGVDIALACPPPRWWSRHCEALMAATVYLDEKPPPALPEMNGCNMAVRRRAIERVGGFSLAMGPGVARCPTGEDSEWSQRLSRAGCALRFRPDMRVVHHLPAERVQLRELLRRSFLSGWQHQRSRHAGSALAQLARTLNRLVIDGGRCMQRGLQRRWADAADRLLWMAREVGTLAGVLARTLDR